MKTTRELVRLGDLHENPFSPYKGRPGDPDTIAALEESIEEAGFWDGLAARSNGKGYQIAFGHHRLEAAINKLGKDYKTSILIGEYSDADMVRMMGLENASEGASTAEQIDYIEKVKQFLVARPQECKMNLARLDSKQASSRERQAATQSEQKHVHGSERCISAFLGQKNYSSFRVHTLLGSSGIEDRTIIDDKRKTGHIATPGKIGHQVAAKLGRLEKPMRTAFTDAIKESKVGLPAPLIEEAIETAVDAVGPDASESQQKKAATAAIKAAEIEQRRTEELRRSKDANDVLQRIIGELMRFEMPWDEDEMKELIAKRHLLKRGIVYSAVKSLRDVAARFESYADKLEAPVPKQLKQKNGGR